MEKIAEKSIYSKKLITNSIKLLLKILHQTTILDNEKISLNDNKIAITSETTISLLLAYFRYSKDLKTID